MPEYTLLTVLAMVLVLLLELTILRTGLLRMPAYWLTMVIVLGFQILVDGWLTKRSAPIVLYDDAQTLGVRFPWDIPVEDFGFGAAMVTLTLMLWLRATRGDAPHPGRSRPEQPQAVHDRSGSSR